MAFTKEFLIAEAYMNELEIERRQGDLQSRTG